jgi:hypothetical protein
VTLTALTAARDGSRAAIGWKHPANSPAVSYEQLLSRSKINPCIFTETRASGFVDRHVWVAMIQHCRHHAEVPLRCCALLHAAERGWRGSSVAPRPTPWTAVCQHLARVRPSTRNLQCIPHSVRGRQPPVLISFTRVGCEVVGNNV